MSKPRQPAPTLTPAPWTFLPRFRRNAFGWKSDTAITRVKEAVATLVGLVAAAEVEDAVRNLWLEPLMTAYLEDGRPWIEALGEH